MVVIAPRRNEARDDHVLAHRRPFRGLVGGLIDETVIVPDRLPVGCQLVPGRAGAGSVLGLGQLGPGRQHGLLHLPLAVSRIGPVIAPGCQACQQD